MSRLLTLVFVGLLPLMAQAAETLTPDQLARLKAAFPHGVCDYSRPGIEQQKAHATWRRY